MSRVRSSVSVVLISAAAAAAAGGAAAWAHERYLPTTRSLSGVEVAGWIEPSDEPLGPWLERVAAAVQSRRVWLAFPSEVIQGSVTYTQTELVEVSPREIGIEVDVAATMANVLSYSSEGSPIHRARRAWVTWRDGAEIPVAWARDPGVARERLARLESRVRAEPVDARLDLVAHERVSERAGRELDLEGSLAALLALKPEDGVVFELETREVPASVTVDMLLDVDVTRVLGSYETDFGGTGAGRAANIARAAALLNGVVILPGQSVSFNALVGPRTLERGFTWAPEIYDDELRPGVGGGVCQVASTLHAAAVMGGLEVVRRRSHSRPSGYVPLGLDATVIYGEVDLKLRNSLDVPLLVHAFLPRSDRLRVELLGREPPGQVSYTYSVSEREEFYRRVTTKPWLGTRKIRKQKGRYGYKVVSLVRVSKPDGTTMLRHYKSEYRPTPEVYWVGPESDLAALPQLPEGAVRVEVDGESADELSDVIEAGAERDG